MMGKKKNNKFKLKPGDDIVIDPPRLIQGQTMLFPLYLNDPENMVSYALVQATTEDAAILWHIYTEPKYRKSGFGTLLIETLQKTFDAISTGVTGNSENMLKQCGFEWCKEHEKKCFMEWRAMEEAC